MHARKAEYYEPAAELADDDEGEAECAERTHAAGDATRERVHVLVNEKMVVHWLQESNGRIATDLRPSLARTTPEFHGHGGEQIILDKLFDVAAGEMRSASTTVAKLARRLVALQPAIFGKKKRAALEEEIHGELRATAQALGLSLDECGLPHLHYERDEDPLQVA